MSFNSFVAPSIFQQTASSKLPILTTIPIQPDSKSLNNCLNGNSTNTHICTKHKTLSPLNTLPLMRPL